jgi:hypothetical protein
VLVFIIFVLLSDFNDGIHKFLTKNLFYGANFAPWILRYRPFGRFYRILSKYLHVSKFTPGNLTENSVQKVVGAKVPVQNLAKLLFLEHFYYLEKGFFCSHFWDLFAQGSFKFFTLGLVAQFDNIGNCICPRHGPIQFISVNYQLSGSWLTLDGFGNIDNIRQVFK